MISPALIHGSTWPTATAVTRYFSFPSGSSPIAVTESQVQQAVPVDCTISNLRIQYATGNPGAGNSFTVTLRKNGVDTAMQVVISDTTVSVVDTTNSVSFTAGDLLSFSVVTNFTGTAPGSNAPGVYFEIDTSSAGGQPIFAGDDATVAASGTGYLSLQQSTLFATQPTVFPPVPTAGTVDRFTARLPVTLTGAQTSTVTLVKNGTDVWTTSLVAANGTTAKIDTTTSPISVAAGDVLYWRFTNGSTSARAVSVSLRFTPTTSGETIHLALDTQAPATGNANYYAMSGGSSTHATGVTGRTVTMNGSWTAQKYYTALALAPSSTFTYTMALTVNGTDSALAAPITGAATSANDTTDSVALVAGDTITLHEKGSSTSITTTNEQFAHAFVLYRSTVVSFVDAATVALTGDANFAGSGILLAGQIVALTADGGFTGAGVILTGGPVIALVADATFTGMGDLALTVVPFMEPPMGGNVVMVVYNGNIV